eukprot:CAMPEP_0196663612 /NCGR_PEP_ID=MMETSP1086-20130531/53547_1 /TAXON_ID=77921 /ORGANISM="Cyanoptyche  gloeocystis , Strain SAG4.97" /LENGTH=198 /DNA_ID=CAMNT_0041999501 /DNA_START=254 /DNA_END=850 /DNA_ORIENTATION=+
MTAREAGSSDDKEPDPVEDAGKPISAVLEMSFRKSWFYLYSSGISDGYIESLQDFLRAVIAAFLRGYSLQALQFELASNEITTGNAQLDERIRLSAEEKQVRTVWLTLAYMTLNAVGYRPRDIPEWVRPAVDDTKGLESLVMGVMDAHRRGYSLESLKLEQTLLLRDGESALPESEAAVRSQWMRIVFLTLDLIEGKP